MPEARPRHHHWVVMKPAYSFIHNACLLLRSTSSPGPGIFNKIQMQPSPKSTSSDSGLSLLRSHHSIAAPSCYAGVNLSFASGYRKWRQQRRQHRYLQIRSCRVKRPSSAILPFVGDRVMTAGCHHQNTSNVRKRPAVVIARPVFDSIVALSQFIASVVAFFFFRSQLSAAWVEIRTGMPEARPMSISLSLRFSLLRSQPPASITRIFSW
jgi:hypothetical protein